jgi:hypothetical protein
MQHGTTNATVHMQAIMEDLMHDIRHSVKIWLDDNMVHVDNEEKLLLVLEHFFKTCLQHGLFLHAASVTYTAQKFATVAASSQQKACGTTRERFLRCNTWVRHRMVVAW